MITKESEHFDDEWFRCLEVIDDANMAMGREFSADEKWIEEMRHKWIEKSDIPDLEEEGAPPPTEEEVKAKEAKEAAEEEERLMGKFKTWKDLRKHLWFHYTDEDVRSRQEDCPWESDESDED
jgi:hypothetical protein